MQVDNTPHRHPELWFDDGSIVIQAENTQFRVHRSILAARSPVFKDMLSFPQPLDAELVEGCPLVHLHDSAAELSVFLRAIFNSEFFMPFPVGTEFDIIVGVLRLSHKYEVEYLRRRALVHLSSGYATTLSKWDRIVHYIPTADNDRVPAMDIITWEWPRDPSYLAVLIPLVGEVGARWMLPSVFYHLSSRLAAFTPRRETLQDILNTIDDQIAFLRGHGIQSHSTFAEILTCLFEKMDDSCPSPLACAQARLFGIDAASKETGPFPCSPLEVWDETTWKAFENYHLCSVCLPSLKAKHKAAREKFWQELPGHYGLPPWEELEKLKADEIGTSWIA
ncbi:hypothetical protein FB45DRAFT_939791 [Roridomyces roridus]|uniref:BTB domain-containing protein n=1 Tax=Roridomyces roridus TaxID=1738132 RepID=A0AAD7B695_9AGAR|nr:hypothetical protein FB45DRAFT_957973 [Roridomyces roridus]KAJ7612066.1 hypothetical protein FB45DRAFT_939791 [Roridomyces roridus]